MKGCRGGKGEEGTSYLQDLVANWRLWEEYWLLPIPSPPSPLPLPSLPLHTYVLSQAPPPPYREHDVIFTRLCCELARLGRDWLLPLPLPPPPYLRLFPSPTPSIQRAWRHIYNSLLRTGAFGNSTDSPPLPPSVFFLPPPPSPSDKEHDVIFSTSSLKSAETSWLAPLALISSSGLTLSLLRVINVKLPLLPHQKYYITQ